MTGRVLPRILSLSQQLLAPCRRKQEQVALAEAARRQQSEQQSLRALFNTNISAPGERPSAVVLVDGYNLLYKVGKYSLLLAVQPTWCAGQLGH
jgi:hypothetical protein